MRTFLSAVAMIAAQASIACPSAHALIQLPDLSVDVVGVLTGEISTPTALVGFVSSKSKSPEAAKALLKYLSGPEAAGVYRAMGMRVGNQSALHD